MADVVVGDNNLNKPSRFSFIKKHKWWILIILLAIPLVVFIIVSLSPKKSQTAFVIEGKSYSKAQIQGMVTCASQYATDSNNSAKDIFDMYRTRQASLSTGIEPSSEGIKNTKKQINLSQKTDKYCQDYVELYVYYKALESSYLNYSYDKTSGYSFVFDFSKGMSEDNSVGPDYENNKAYAKQKAYYYYDQLKSKKITPDELLSEIRKDNRISRLPLSTHFGPNQSGNLLSQLFNPDIYNYVINQKKPGLSKVMIAKVQNSTSKTNPQYREAYYYFVQVDVVGVHAKVPSEKIKEAKDRQTVSYYGVSNDNK